ncbi:MAG: glycosyltransferase [Candidatus Gottesmanbacteria bacterium]
MGKPFFSIIIPALNEEKFLPRLLKSLSHQHITNFEVIVVDGKSKDKTVKVASAFIGVVPSLSVIVADHASLPYQRNVGADHAKGDWFVFVDADTVLYSYTLERLQAHVFSSEESFFTTWFSPDSEDINDVRLTLFGIFFYELSKTIKRAVSPGPFTVVRKTVFHSIGGYDVEHPFLEDQDFSQRMTKHGYALSIIRETLYIWSLRRYRQEGTVKIFQAYTKALLPILFTKKVPKNMKGYQMGGHVFSKKKKNVKTPLLKQTEQRMKKLMQDIFE